jgi:transcriptional antiterminator RfaH
MTNEEDRRHKLAWFAAQLRPQGLKRAVDHLHRQKFETFAPELESTVIRAGVRRQIRKPLFPGYLFVSFDPAIAKWTAINSTRGVARLILDRPDRPTPLPPSFMAEIMARYDKAGHLLPPPNLNVGDTVRVLTGSFAEIVTKIEALPDQERIGVLIELMGRKVKTSLARCQVEKVDL